MLVLREKLSSGLIREWELQRIHTWAKTQHQEVLIADTAHGTTLFCEGERQSASSTQLLYHEAMTVPAMCLLEQTQRQNALILGSSEGVVSQILAKCFERVVHVDIDQHCVDLCAQYLPYGYSWDSQKKTFILPDKVSFIREDGATFIKTYKYTYDLIVMDLPDESVAKNLTVDGMYADTMLLSIKHKLARNGVFITQAGCPTYWRHDTLQRLLNRMRPIFEQVVYWECAEHEWSWLIGLNRRIEDVKDKIRWQMNLLPYRPVTINSDDLARYLTIPTNLFARNLHSSIL